MLLLVLEDVFLNNNATLTAGLGCCVRSFDNLFDCFICPAICEGICDEENPECNLESRLCSKRLVDENAEIKGRTVSGHFVP